MYARRTSRIISLLLTLGLGAALAPGINSQSCAATPWEAACWWQVEGDGVDLLSGFHGTVSRGTFVAGVVGHGFQTDGVIGGGILVPEAGGFAVRRLVVDHIPGE